MNDILNPIIPSKPRLHAQFGPTMIKYAFTSPPPIVGAKEKAIHGQTMGQTDRLT